jgi:hypothetical protein
MGRLGDGRIGQWEFYLCGSLGNNSKELTQRATENAQRDTEKNQIQNFSLASFSISSSFTIGLILNEY